MHTSSKHYETYQLQWMGIPYTLTWKPNYIEGVIAHLEIRSENGEALPITETGYRSHFIQREIVEELG